MTILVTDCIQLSIRKKKTSKKQKSHPMGVRLIHASLGALYWKRLIDWLRFNIINSTKSQVELHLNFCQADRIQKQVSMVKPTKYI